MKEVRVVLSQLHILTRVVCPSLSLSLSCAQVESLLSWKAKLEAQAKNKAATTIQRHWYV